ncbi:endonuclease domain-containing protein [Longimicrobium sp.]|uniref:endonuclease domain-containing protein n=1 Tax=Longimicrobium sp. TaxID=2029185 RepID=UPI0032C22CCE
MRGRTRQILEASRALRADTTYAEGVLWQALRGESVPGLRFRRQHAIGRVILDFYCPAVRLAIEVDGGVHDDEAQADRDGARTEALAHLGIRVIRFRNGEIVQQLPSVLGRIRQTAAEQPREKSGTTPGAPH